MCNPYIFYAFSGCDKVSSLYTNGECKGWYFWRQNRSEFDEVFIRIWNRPSDVTEADMNAIESFVTKMYIKLSKISLTDLRIDMFKSLTDKDLWKLPPSRRALEKHIRRACYQAGYVWQLVIFLSLIVKTGDRYLKEICISHNGNRKGVQ